VILRPCLHCRFKVGCEIKRDLLDRARPLKLTVASFKCAKRDTDFRIGQRVQATFTCLIDSEHPYYERYRDEDHAGTIIRRKNGKLVVWLDEPLDAAGKRVIVKLWPDRPDLVALDEPDSELCGTCFKPKGKQNLEGWVCHDCF
jgi:hypothetical protein